jgi:hypothetical protein
MCGNVILIDTEPPAGTNQKIKDLDELFDRYDALIFHFNEAMAQFHSEYMAMLAPVVLELAKDAANGRVIIMDDFIESLHIHATLLCQQSKELKSEFARHRRVANNLIRLSK